MMMMMMMMMMKILGVNCCCPLWGRVEKKPFYRLQ